MAELKHVLVGPFPHWDVLHDDLAARNWPVESVESGAEAFRELTGGRGVAAVILSTHLRDGPALNLIRQARAAGSVADFLVVAPQDGPPFDRAALLEEGAEEIYDAPIDRDQILAKLELLRGRRELIEDLGLVVRDPSMLELFERVLRVAPLKVTVLVTGESGTGKEMLAQALHRASDRKEGPFVPVNVGAIPENLVESELFGHEKGAFTSADTRRIGRFEMADRGTLFLDEIGEMPLSAQVNLLRVLEEEQFLRVGGSQKISVDVRIVAATNRNLEEMVREGSFRRDLFYRLKVVSLDVPPLRARRREIPILVKRLSADVATKHGIVFPGFTPDAIERLSRYEWPGNVRELRNLIDGIVALAPTQAVSGVDLPTHVQHGSSGERALPVVRPDQTGADREFVIQSLLALRAEIAALRELILARTGGVQTESPYAGLPASHEAVFPTTPVRVEGGDADSLSLKEIERRAIVRALRESGGNRRAAAESLGMSERTLYRRIKEFGLSEHVSERGDF